jgi:hypothetical protein
MSWFIVDTRDWVAQRVTEDAARPPVERFVKLCADTVEEAFEIVRRRAATTRSTIAG